MKRLLLLSCSKRKLGAPGLLAASDRYDGPAFRILRSFRNMNPDADLSTWVLSAEYGLISEHETIPLYNRRMSRARAAEIRDLIASRLSRLLSSDQIDDAMLCLGREYRAAVSSSCMPEHVKFASGGYGQMLSQLHDWLHGRTYDAPKPRSGPVRFCGQLVAAKPDAILELARAGLASRDARAFARAVWYVDVDGQEVSPKWLASQLTRVPVSMFRTADALRLLGNLGIQVGHR
jgi:hypothetical protein